MFKVWGLDVVTLGYLNHKSTQNECLIVSFSRSGPLLLPFWGSR